MDPKRFAGVLATYRSDLTDGQIDVLMECARSLPTWDWEGFVDLVLLTQTLARPDVRPRDLSERTHTPRLRPYVHLLVSL